MKIICLTILTVIFIPQIISAEVFHLKNGSIIKGELIREDETGITVKIKYGIIKIEKSNIAPPEATQAAMPPPPTGKTVYHAPAVQSSHLDDKWISKEKQDNMDRWLTGQISEKTGLLESFNPSADVYMEKQAATYDQALAGLAFLLLRDRRKSKGILEFYRKKWNGNGFSNFYFTPTGNPGIESTVHLGPNLWIALLALHYDRESGRKQYQQLAENIVGWAMKLPHYKGGAVMSDKDEWRAPWTKVVSTENNIDLYSVLSILESRVKDKKLKADIMKEKSNVRDFLINVAYDRKSGGFCRGFHEGKIDRESALDTVTWMVAAVGMRQLQAWGIDRARLMAFVESRFLVADEGIKGFDFTDKRGAFKAKRPRMISIEWTLAMVNMYYMYRNYYLQTAEQQEESGNYKKACKLYQWAEIYDHKAVFYLGQMDKKILEFGPRRNMYSYPYATRSFWLVFYDSPWWKTPKTGKNGIPAGSVASTSWRVFAGRFNPLNDQGKM